MGLLHHFSLRGHSTGGPAGTEGRAPSSSYTLRKAKADGSWLPSVSVHRSWGWDGVRGSAGGESGQSTALGRATSSMPANRDRLREGPVAPAAFPAGRPATSSSRGQAGTMALGGPGGSASTPCSWPGAATGTGSGAALRAGRRLSPAGGDTSVSRSLVHGAAHTVRMEGSECGRAAFGEGWSLQSASNCRRSCEEKSGTGGVRAALGRGSAPAPPPTQRNCPGDQPRCRHPGTSPGVAVQGPALSPGEGASHPGLPAPEFPPLWDTHGTFPSAGCP